MGFRYLTESSTLGFSENIHLSREDSSIEIKPIISEKTGEIIYLEDFKDPAKFHIGMLSVSLVAGLTYSVFVTYNSWREKNVFLSHIRNLVIALTCKTFFSILFDGVIILESPLDADGGNTLLSFECISQNLVVAFWLTLTIYIHARVQRNFNSEPTLKLYMFGVPGVAVYFAMVQIFAMEGTHSSQVWWLLYYILYFYQWVVNSLRLLYLLIQLALLIDIGRMMVIKSSDNDTISLIRKIVLLMAALVLLFWLQFGLSVGRPPLSNPQPYLYFYHLIDGTLGLLVCLILFFFNKWVPMILDKLPNITMESGEMAERMPRPNDEVLIRRDDDKGIVTIGSLLVKQESGRWSNMISDEREDVVYSSVVQPQNLQKTIDLYKRLNVIPVDNVTVVEGEEFYDCDYGNDLKRSESLLFKPLRNLEPEKSSKSENKVNERVVKKNAFYSSRYLIVDPKEKDIPKYLETRPSKAVTGKEVLKEFRSKPPTSLETLGADELVKKWLTDHSGDMEEAQKKRKNFEQASIKKRKVEEEKIWQNTLLEQHRQSVSKIISPTVNSVSLGTLFTPRKEENLEVSPEILNANKDSNRSLQNLNISEARSQKNSRLKQSEINVSNDQFKTGRNFKKVSDFRVAEKQISEGDAELGREKNEAMQKTAQNNFESIGNIQHSEREENIKEIYQIPSNAKGDAREISEDANKDAMRTSSKSKCESNPSESGLEETNPPEEKKILIPANDFERGVTNKDEAGASKSRLESETDTEKSPGTFAESQLLDDTKGWDLKNPGDFQSLTSSKNATQENLENSEANDLTYSKLLDFRSQRDELERENSGAKDQKMKTPGLNEIS